MLDKNYVDTKNNLFTRSTGMKDFAGFVATLNTILRSLHNEMKGNVLTMGTVFCLHLTRNVALKIQNESFLFSPNIKIYRNGTTTKYSKKQKKTTNITGIGENFRKFELIEVPVVYGSGNPFLLVWHYIQYLLMNELKLQTNF